MHRNMFGFIAFDFILRLFRTTPAHVPFVFGILRVLFLITPDTSPASEFHRTWSPTLNVLLIFPLLRKLQLLAQGLTYPALRHLPTG